MQPPVYLLVKRYMERLGRKMKCRISYAAALERRTSGLGASGIPLHWHFLAACELPYGMTTEAENLWNKMFGNAKVEPYDPTHNGTFYLSKLAAHRNGVIEFDHLELLPYRGPSDLIMAARCNPYVPDHLKDKAHGQYLVVR